MIITRPKTIDLAIFFYLLAVLLSYVDHYLTNEVIFDEPLLNYLFFRFIALLCLLIPIFFIWRGSWFWSKWTSIFILAYLILDFTTFYQKLISYDFPELILLLVIHASMIAFLILLFLPVSSLWLVGKNKRK